MEKYGFVYLWRDRKRGMFYVGCHWGSEDDGYICSSNRMRNAYKRRPKDFKRKILKRVYTNRQELQLLEHSYLSLIEDEELGKKYYNLTKHINGHWSDDLHKSKTLREKISIKTKEAMERPDVRKRYEEGLSKRNNKSSCHITREKRRQSMIKTMAEKFPVENRRQPLTVEERYKYYSDKAKKMHSNRTEEQRLEINRKISEANKRNPKPNLTCPHCLKEGGYMAMKRWHFDNCKGVSTPHGG